MSIIVNKRPSERCWAGNPCNYELYSAAAATDANIYFEVKLMFRFPGGGYAEVIRFPFYPTSGTANVDVKDLVNGKLTYGIPPFTGTETDAYIAPNQTGYFYIAYREVEPGTAAGLFDESEVEFERLAVKGGISYMKWRGNAYWDDYYTPNHPFFTWQKNGRMANLQERMYLAWLNHSSITDLILKVNITYTDGTTSIDNNFPIASPVYNKIIYLPVGAAQLSLAGITPAKTIYKWIVAVYTDSGSETRISEEFTYYADNRKDYNDTTLHYRNSLGGLDSVRIRGVIEQKLEYENERQAVITGFDYYNGSSIAAQEKVINNREKMLYSGDIGFVEKEEQDRMRDMHLSREMWWELALKWIPVQNVTGNFRKSLSSDNLWSMIIDWLLGIPGDAFYTPRLMDIGDGGVDSNVCASTVSGVTITKTLNVSDADIEFNATITGATQFTYQIIGFHASPITANVADLPITVTGLPLAQNFVLRLRGMCADGSMGKKTDTPFVTAAETFNSAIYNNTDFWDEFDIYLDGSVIQPDVALNPTEYNFFNEAATGSHTIKVGYGNGIPTVALLKVDGTTYTGTIGSVEATWPAVTLTNGFTIELY